jgi:hypothetical protein
MHNPFSAYIQLSVQIVLSLLVNMKLISIALLPFLLARGISSERALQSDEINDPFSQQLQKKQFVTLYTPDFRALYIDANLDPWGDARPHCYRF